MASHEGRGKLLERYQLSPAGLHVTPAKRTARSQAESAGRGAGKFLRPGRAAASASGSGEQAQFRSSHLRHHTLYPSEVSVTLPATSTCILFRSVMALRSMGQASSLYKLLPDDFAPYWMRAPGLSRFLDRLALLCIAEVSVHAVHLVMVSES
jgi:hypothetical protein